MKRKKKDSRKKRGEKRQEGRNVRMHLSHYLHGEAVSQGKGSGVLEKLREGLTEPGDSHRAYCPGTLQGSLLTG